MQIVRLQIKNFLSISDAEIRPGQVNQVTGANNQGKTSILRAIEVACKGSTDGSLVKRGEDAAEIIVEFNDETTVRRRLTASGKQSVDVKRGSFAAPAPQTFLSALFSAGAFNPLELLDPKTRTEAILKLVPAKLDEATLAAYVGESPVPLPPLDYEQHGLKVAEQAHRYFYQRRAEANKEAKARGEVFHVKQSEFDALPPLPALAFPDLTEEQLKARGRELRAVVEAEMAGAREADEARKRVESLLMKHAGTKTTIGDIRREQERLKRLEEQAIEACAKLEAEIDEARNVAASKSMDERKVLEANAEIDRLVNEVGVRDAIKARMARRDSLEVVKSAFDQATEFAEKLSAITTKLAGPLRAKLMSENPVSIQGLTYEDGQFFLDGDSIDNLSSSKSMRLAVALARTLAGPAKIICIDGAEMLDEKTYGELRDEIEGDGFTYFLTKVGLPFEHAGDAVITMKGGEVQA